VIQAGSDADIAIWDPEKSDAIRAAADHSKSDYSVYEGWQVKGWPVMTIRRGEVVFDAGNIVARAGTGQLIKRQPWRQ
jgi:dihydropyrimidinase